MATDKQQLSEDTQRAHDYLLEIGKLTVDFAAVERVLHYPPGRPENDVEHSYHLAVSAIEIAADFHPELDTGLVAQFSLVHDLPEVYVGDVPTFDISDIERAAKEAAEKVATQRLLKELPPHLAQLLERYEEQVEPEARFVRFIDKLLPAIIHATVPDANREVFRQKYNMTTAKEIEVNEPVRIAHLQKMFPEFDFIHIVHGLIVQSSRDRVFNRETK